MDEGALRELRSEVDELRAAADRRAADAEAVALARLRAEADMAALRQQADRVSSSTQHQPTVAAGNRLHVGGGGTGSQ